MNFNLKLKRKEDKSKISFNFRSWFAAQNKLRLFFQFLGILSVLFWIAWAYFSGFQPVEVEVNRRAQTIINLDQAAYKATSVYIESIKEYQLPDFNSLYDNPEPFMEYAQ